MNLMPAAVFFGVTGLVKRKVPLTFVALVNLPVQTRWPVREGAR